MFYDTFRVQGLTIETDNSDFDYKVIPGFVGACIDDQNAKEELNKQQYQQSKVLRYYQSIITNANNFALQVKVTLGLDIACSVGQVATVGLNGTLMIMSNYED